MGERRTAALDSRSPIARDDSIETAQARRSEDRVRLENEMARKLKIIIIGAGIGGLTAALALRRHGFEVLVCERAGAQNDIGAGIQLGPNAVKTYRALGIEAAI